jgi:hypothetical protein
MTSRFDAFKNAAVGRITDWWGLQKQQIQKGKNRANELYGEQESQADGELLDIVAFEGLLQVYRTHPGLRKVVTLPSIWTRPDAVICNGDLPDPSENLPEPIANLKRAVARKFMADVDGVYVTSEYVSIEMREERPDRVPKALIQTLASTMFMTYPSLQSVRLAIDSQAAESRLDGLVIPRSNLEPPPNLAPTS